MKQAKNRIEGFRELVNGGNTFNFIALFFILTLFISRETLPIVYDGLALVVVNSLQSNIVGFENALLTVTHIKRSTCCDFHFSCKIIFITLHLFKKFVDVTFISYDRKILRHISGEKMIFLVSIN